MISSKNTKISLLWCRCTVQAMKAWVRDVPGCPAFIRISNWWSLMILCGWLISAHHLAIWALKFHKWLHSEYEWSTHLDSSVVWAQWDILMGGWPWWVSTANINSSHPPGCVFLSADLTRCWPKHLTAWLLRLDMAAQIVWLNIWTSLVWVNSSAVMKQ